MKKIFILFSFLLIIIIYGCGIEESVTEIKESPEKITAWTYKIDDIKLEEVEEETITTVRLCYDSENGIVRWVNGSIIGFYEN